MNKIFLLHESIEGLEMHADRLKDPTKRTNLIEAADELSRSLDEINYYILHGDKHKFSSDFKIRFQFLLIKRFSEMRDERPEWRVYFAKIFNAAWELGVISSLQKLYTDGSARFFVQTRRQNKIDSIRDAFQELDKGDKDKPSV